MTRDSDERLSAPAVETRGLTKLFQDKVVALSPMDLVVRRGSVFGLIGPNAAGKTTAFRMLIGLQRPTAGEVRIFGERMDANAAHLRRRIGYLPTSARFPPSATPVEYLRFVGESVEQVSSFLDHSNLQVTTTYLRRLEGEEDAGWRKVAALLA